MLSPEWQGAGGGLPRAKSPEKSGVVKFDVVSGMQGVGSGWGQGGAGRRPADYPGVPTPRYRARRDDRFASPRNALRWPGSTSSRRNSGADVTTRVAESWVPVTRGEGWGGVW